MDAACSYPASGERLTHAWPVETGIMVEIPSAACSVGRWPSGFLQHRRNDHNTHWRAQQPLSGLADALQACCAGSQWLRRRMPRAVVGVCGELAGDPLAAPI
jgi:hypothetical protein